MKLQKKNNCSIIPVDSEHSAVFQCLESNSNSEQIERIILTASGGPFRNMQRNQLVDVTVKQALNHPNWSMGNKITIDSATMMNKGLEVIEAKWLFDVMLNNIEVVVHPQSIVHSMVSFIDGTVLAQLSYPSMKVAILYALTYPDRLVSGTKPLDIVTMNNLTFEAPDMNAFPCLELAYKALEMSGTAPVILNAANEVAVDLFLNEKIGFLDIPRIIEKAMYKHKIVRNPSLMDIVNTDKEIKEWIKIDFNNFLVGGN